MFSGNFFGMTSVDMYMWTIIMGLRQSEEKQLWICHLSVCTLPAPKSRMTTRRSHWQETTALGLDFRGQEKVKLSKVRVTGPTSGQPANLPHLATGSV